MKNPNYFLIIMKFELILYPMKMISYNITFNKRYYIILIFSL